VLHASFSEPVVPSATLLPDVRDRSSIARPSCLK